MSQTNNKEDSGKEEWSIDGGCYKDGAYTRMVKAIPDFTYEFNKVPIEVRANVDPFADKPEEEELEAEDPNRSKSGFSFWKFMMWLFFLLFVIFLILLIVIYVIAFMQQRKQNNEEKRRLMTDSQSQSQGV